MNDWELIQAHNRDGSESAFETLVKRHVDFVYCAALRQVRDPSLAQDVSQAVFLLLARKARSFGSGTVLVSWLFRSTQFVAARALRTELRRQRREIEVAQMNPPLTSQETEQQWKRVAPVLDEAIAALPSHDRDAVLLRFFSRKPFSQVGASMGVSEDAAKKRVNRALARLREFFTRRGTTLSAAAIVAILGERVVQAAPAGLATKIAAAGAGASVTATTAAALLQTALRDLFWAKAKWGTAISVGVIGVLLLISSALRPVATDAIVAIAIPPTDSETLADSVTVDSDAGAKEEPANRTLRLFVAQVEDRQPVPGARVMVECWEGSNRRQLLDAATDSQGGLDIPIPAQTFNLLQIWISAEGRVPIVMRWQGHEFNEPVILHSIVLEAGNAAVGTVRDESGNPIFNAKVSFSGPGIDLAKRENRHFHPELSASVTDADGRWTTTQLPPQVPGKSGVSIRVTHLDFIPMSLGVGRLAGFPTNAIVILSNGVALSGRVTAVDGSPIPNARVAKQSGSAYVSTKTDADGRFHWPHVEPGQVFVDVEAKGFETIHEFAWATNAANDCVFTLKPSSNTVPTTWDGPRARLHGSVVDAETGEAIPRFKVLRGYGGNLMPRSFSEGVLHGADLLGEGNAGRFDWKDIPCSSDFRLQVEAEGYLESVSEDRTYKTAGEEFNFKLHRSALLVGRVLMPDGVSAENAVVSLAGRGFGPVMQAPGRLIEPNPGFETTRTRTDREGDFRLKLKTGARGVAVIHENGSALLTFAAATNSPIILQPWGAIEGTLFLNGQPAHNQRVFLTGCQKSETDPLLLFSFSYGTPTDDDGRFRFDRVLPGEHFVARQVVFPGGGQAVGNSTHATLVTVESGAVASIELRKLGRPVIGRIVFDGSPEDVHWGMSQATLQVEGATPPKVDYERDPAASARAWSLHQALTRFPFALSKDGPVRADDVPPGAYTLAIQLESATVDPQISSKPPFGSLQKQVIVPPADDQTVPVDLGVLTIERAK